MKNFKTFFYSSICCLLLVLSTSSCKEATKQTDNQNSDVTYSEFTRFRGAMSNLNLNDQRHIFTTLPNDVKYALWQDRFTSRMEFSKSDKEKAALKKILENFPKNIYEDSMAKVNFQNFIQQSFTETLEAFGNDSTRVHTLFYRLGDNNVVTPLFIKGGLPDCNCNMKKDWCVLGTCTSGNCDSSSYGCGPTWLWQCNGTCQ